MHDFTRRIINQRLISIREDKMAIKMFHVIQLVEINQTFLPSSLNKLATMRGEGEKVQSKFFYSFYYMRVMSSTKL